MASKPLKDAKKEFQEKTESLESSLYCDLHDMPKIDFDRNVNVIVRIKANIHEIKRLTKSIK